MPSVLRNIEVLSFDLGSIPPEITIKDITDPFPEFYEDDAANVLNTDDASSDEEDDVQTRADASPNTGAGSLSSSPEQRRHSIGLGRPPRISSHRNNINESTHERAITMDDLETASSSSGPPPYDAHLSHRPMNSANGWEGMNLPYFHSAFATPSNGIVSASGLSTPRPRFMGAINTLQPIGPMGGQARNISTSYGLAGQRTVSGANAANISGRRHLRISSAESLYKPDHKVTEDTQIEVHVQYQGDIVMHLKVDLALNYPSPSFVTLPIEMTLSELEIDAVAVLAYIDAKLHVSLLEGPESPMKNLKIESRIGEQAKVSLNDVEKIEKFMLKEVQDMVERELVFPSYYTFLI